MNNERKRKMENEFEIKSILEFAKFLSDDCILTEEVLYEMARVQRKNSGLPQQIFVTTRDYGTGNHWARIKVSNIPDTFSKTDNFVVTISKTPQVVAGKHKFNASQLEDVFDWVKLNYDTLLKYWNKEYDDDADFYAELKKV